MVLEDLFKKPSAINRFRMPPLGEEIDNFCEWLRRQGFSRIVMRQKIWEVSHFNRYLQQVGIKKCQDVDRCHAELFIFEHLPQCQCSGRGIFKRMNEPRSVRSFLHYLSDRGLLEVVSETNPLYQPLLEEFLNYLKNDRNLSTQTLKLRRCYLIPFLEYLGADAFPSNLGKLTAESVQSFFFMYIEKKNACTINRALQSTLRSFFRFCRKQGYIRLDLAEAVPPIRIYKLATVPQGLLDQDVQKVLAHIDRKTPAGLRDFAIIQLLRTYGIRGGQVCALQLQDIKWSQSRIRFPAMKRGKEIVAPLTNEVGESMLDYLRRGRPQVVWSEVFLTARAPIHPIKNSGTITAIVVESMRRAGVTAPVKGSRSFRHAFATRMLQHGQSMKTIADMLGHRDINTTFIYSKVDLNTLYQLPLVWPEVQ